MLDHFAIFTGNANRQLAQDICDYLGVPLGQADVFAFSNENTFVKINENVRERDVFVVQPTSSPVNTSIMELLIMLDALKRASASRITAIVPFFSYARTDKKDQGRVPITARLVADLISVAGANRVVTMDLHAGQIQGFFSIPVDELTALKLTSDYFRRKALDDLVVVSADIGYAKKARNFADLMQAPLAIVEKRRRSNDDNPEVLNLIGDISSRALIVDDEIDTANSICQAVDVVRKAGAREIYVCATHAVLTGHAVEKLRAADLAEFVITDSMPIPPRKRIPNMTVLSVAPLIGEAIKSIHSGTSISRLFR